MLAERIKLMDFPALFYSLTSITSKNLIQKVSRALFNDLKKYNEKI